VHWRHQRAADAQMSGSLVLSRTRWCRQQSRRHIARMPCWHRQMRECASAVLGACRPLLDLTYMLSLSLPTTQGLP
jgi:hypothetical protein